MLALSLSIVACSKDAVEEIVPPEEEKIPDKDQGGNENPSDSTGIDVPGKDTTEFKYVEDLDYAKKFINWRKIHVNINEEKGKVEEVMLFSSKNPKRDFYSEIQGKIWNTVKDVVIKQPILHAKTPVSVDMWIPKDLDTLYFIDNKGHCIKDKEELNITYKSSLRTYFKQFEKGGCEIYKKAAGKFNAFFDRNIKKFTMEIEFYGSVTEEDKDNYNMIADWLRYELRPVLNGYILDLENGKTCTSLIPKQLGRVGYYGPDPESYMDIDTFKEYVKAGNIKVPDLHEPPKTYTFKNLDGKGWSYSSVNPNITFLLVDCITKEVYDLRSPGKSYVVIKKGNGVYDVRFELGVPIGEDGDPDLFDSYYDLTFRVTIKEEQGTSNQVVRFGTEDPTKKIMDDKEEYTYRAGAYFIEDKPQDDMDFNDMIGIYAEKDCFKPGGRIYRYVKEIIKSPDPDIYVDKYNQQVDYQYVVYIDLFLSTYTLGYYRKIYGGKPEHGVNPDRPYPGYYYQRVIGNTVNTEEYPFIIDIPLPAFYDDNDTKIGYAPEGKKLSDIYDFMGSADWYRKIKGGAILLDNPDFRNDPLFDFSIPEKE